MYFYRKQGKQHVDFRGDFILSHNDAVIVSRSKSAGPFKAHNGLHVTGIRRRHWRAKLVATFAAIRFIWGADTSLRPKVMDAEGI